MNRERSPLGSRGWRHSFSYPVWLRSTSLVILVGATSLIGASCGSDREGGDIPDEGIELVDAAGDTVVEGPLAQEADVERGPRPEVIYYDLTFFEWYKKGEPILLDHGRYLPGEVEPTAERHFVKEGVYEGVDYYRAQGGDDEGSDIIYVPVYEGYWLPFSLEGAGSSSTVE